MINDVLFRTDDIALRFLRESDLELMCEWLRNPSVNEFYGGNAYSDADFVKKHFIKRVNGNAPVKGCIILKNTVPVGYLQYYRIDDSYELEDPELFNRYLNPYGIDLFLGNENYFSCGTGSALLKAFSDYLLDNMADAVLIDPIVRNRRAVCCYLKAGFSKLTVVKEREELNGIFEDSVIMIKKKKEKILVSACLLGVPCKYNGKTNADISELIREHFEPVYICPEQAGGLSTPRSPAEVLDGRVISRTGLDVTDNYQRGARNALYVAKKLNIKRAILKAKSPSCGKNRIYDGTFSKTLIEGNGVTAQLLIENGIEIYDENDFRELIDQEVEK